VAVGPGAGRHSRLQAPPRSFLKWTGLKWTGNVVCHGRVAEYRRHGSSTGFGWVTPSLSTERKATRVVGGLGFNNGSPLNLKAIR